jgi:Undecaprenyl-phosphate galactose phosphotransferase WbaP
MTKKAIISGILLLTDVLVLYAIFYFAVILRDIVVPLTGMILVTELHLTWEAALPIAQLGILVGIGTFFFQGLYPGYGLTAVRELERIFKSITLTFFLLAAVFYLNKPFQELPRSVLLIAWVLALGILPVTHFAIRNILSRFSWYGVPVVIFGDDEWAQQVSKSLKNVRRLGWRPQAILPLHDLERLSAVPSDRVLIIAASADYPIEKHTHLFTRSFPKVILVREADRFGSLWVEPRDLDGKLGLEFSYHLLGSTAIRLKRMFDIFGSFCLLVLLSPFFLLVAFLIFLESPGPVFYTQERLSQPMRRFRVIKFRTMALHAEAELEKYLQKNPVARAEYEKYHKLRYDPRTTRVGRWLRRFSIDEFPQLWNVLRGEMSLVGPRAYMPAELEEIGEYAPVILRVKPGITGWWQVTGRHHTSFRQRLQKDEYYISNWSLWMDLYILIKTVWVVLVASGA